MRLGKYQHIDLGELLATVGNDWEALASLAQTYLETAPSILQRLEQDMQAGNTDSAWRQSHTLKGMSALIGAATLVALLQETELTAKSGQLPDIQARQALAARFALVIDELRRCLEGHENS